MSEKEGAVEKEEGRGGEGRGGVGRCPRWRDVPLPVVPSSCRLSSSSPFLALAAEWISRGSYNMALMAVHTRACKLAGLSRIIWVGI